MMPAFRNSLLVCLVVTCALLSARASNGNPSDDYTLYLVRHAEKVADGSKDPNLTDAGRERADNIAERLQNKGIEDVWSSDYQRTRNTAGPLAAQLGLELEIYNPKNQTEFLTQLQQRHNNALIVGHSNTIPELARMLCQCEVGDMDETEYDRLIVIDVLNGQPKLQSLRQ